MKQAIKDLIEIEMDQCWDYSHWSELKINMTEDEIQCYRTGRIDGYKSALMVIEQYVTGDEEY
tara:strand:- start:259 stop:447 length:189 start_codon:yes stop_codon:yes gene_type:complete